MDATGGTPHKRDPRYTDPTTPQQRAEISRRVWAARRALGLSQPQLAAATGVSTRVISRIENGHPAEPRGRDTIVAYLQQADELPGPLPLPADAGGMDLSDVLSDVPSVALLAELGRRLGEQEQRAKNPRTGPPVRVRWKTADGPTQAGTSDQRERVQNTPQKGVTSHIP